MLPSSIFRNLNPAVKLRFNSDSKTNVAFHTTKQRAHIDMHYLSIEDEEAFLGAESLNDATDDPARSSAVRSTPANHQRAAQPDSPAQLPAESSNSRRSRNRRTRIVRRAPRLDSFASTSSDATFHHGELDSTSSRGLSSKRRAFSTTNRGKRQSTEAGPSRRTSNLANNNNNIDPSDFENTNLRISGNIFPKVKSASTVPTRRVPSGRNSADDLIVLDRSEQYSFLMSDLRGFPMDARRSADARGQCTPNSEIFSRMDDDPSRLSAILIHNPAKPAFENTAGSCNSAIDRLHYLPLVSRSHAGEYLTVLPSHNERIQRSATPSAHYSTTWPLNDIPLELFDLIIIHLARDDVKSMRLVCKEFELKVSASLFHTSVVPFNTELYDMIDGDQKISERAPNPISKGKAKMKDIFEEPSGVFAGPEARGLHWKNAMEDKEDKLYRGHGLRVFQGFGPHIKRFGMSFDIAESHLANPPSKKGLDPVVSYHGSYAWPSDQYNRFAGLAGLENTADDTSRMKAAFQKLKIVQELALSVDSGLGWLSGPDRSVRGRIFERPSAIFGPAWDVYDHTRQAAEDLWAALEQSQQSFAPQASMREIMVDYHNLTGTSQEVDGLQGQVQANTQLWSTIEQRKLLPFKIPVGMGLLYTTNSPHPMESIAHKSTTLMPGQLSKDQKEWLLETQWAQQAFMESYVLAVTDNPSTFCNVKTLNIAKLSSRFLPMLTRDSFWDALPALNNLILHISPDWRVVEKDDAGNAEIRNKAPSEAIYMFHAEVLRDQIADRESIKKLNVGWVGGGEHAQGLFARNNHLLPSPVTQLEFCLVPSGDFALVFDHVEELTLHNCWITPVTLRALVSVHADKALQKLILDSVSLTAMPRPPAMPIISALGPGVAVQAFNIPPLSAAQISHMHHMMHPQVRPTLSHAQVQQLQQMQHVLHLTNTASNIAPNVLTANPQQYNAWAAHYQQAMNVGPLGLPGGVANVHAAAFAHAMAHPHAPPNAAQPAVAPDNSHWTSGPREGSWPHLLNLISPGPVLDDYTSGPAARSSSPPPHPTATLLSIEFHSCGYVKLPCPNNLDQAFLEPDHHNRNNNRGLRRNSMTPWFTHRYACLKPFMMSTSDRYQGHIVQYMPPRELNALRYTWGLVEGWKDREKAEEPEYDGLLLGGTGRFSGVVKRGMAV